MRAAYLPSNGRPMIVEIENRLDVLQRLVSGYIETDRLTPDLIAIINENGIALGLPPNVNMVPKRWYLGNVVIVRAPYWAEDFSSLTDDDIKNLRKELQIKFGGDDDDA